MVKAKPKVIVYISSDSGGIAEYAVCQCKALMKLGVDVISLVSPEFLEGRQTGLMNTVCLMAPPEKGGTRFVKGVGMLWRSIANRFILAWQICKHRPDLVLLDTYVEYFSPFWIWPHWLLSKLGIRYGANLHDPVRNFVVGPVWWHRLSVRMAYLPLEFVTVHHRLEGPSVVPPSVRVIEVPHGLYEVSMDRNDPEIVRAEWGVKEGQTVFLSFGYVRDNKNLNLVIQALALIPEGFLVVAGSVASSSDKPFSYYRRMAARLGVSDRCYFAEGFVSDEELGKYFAGSDIVMLSYAASFHSQSGVLSIAASARKPVIASAAPSPLIDAVSNYHLGVTVLPDSEAALVEGMKCILSKKMEPLWDEYEAAASWDVNVRKILHEARLSGS